MRKIVMSTGLGFILAVSVYGSWKINAQRGKHPDVSAITVHLDIKRLEQILFKLDTRAEISAFLQAHPLFAKQFLSLSPHNTPERMIERLYAMIHNPGMQDLYQEVQRIFGDLTAVEQQLNQAFQYLQYYYPDFQVPQVATFITGMGTDLYVSKDLIVLGLDFFMGKGAKYRPQELPQYLLRTYQPENIVPKTILRLARQFIQTAPKDQTLLADMLYYGKAYYFVKAMLPEVDEYLLLGYTQKQLADVQRHQRLIWEHFIEQKLLYTTKRLCKNKYIDERPFTAEIGQSCPGKIGRWLGWAIIKKYMQDHPHVHLSALLKNPNAKSLFIQSKYRPER